MRRVPSRFPRGRRRQSPGRAGFDYIALGGVSPRTLLSTDGTLTHHPGSTQSAHFDEPGPSGCTLLEVEPGRQPRSTLIPTATVRYERYALRDSTGQSEEKLLHEMVDRLAGTVPLAREVLRCIEWRVATRAESVGWSEPATCDRLAREAVSRAFSEPLRVLVGVRAVQDDLPQTDDPLLAEFYSELIETFRDTGWITDAAPEHTSIRRAWTR